MVLITTCTSASVNRISPQRVPKTPDPGVSEASNSFQNILTARLPPETESEIRQALASRANGMPQPAAILLAHHLPRLPSGKPDRSAAKNLQVWTDVLSGSGKSESTRATGGPPSFEKPDQTGPLTQWKRARTDTRSSPPPGSPASVLLEHAVSRTSGLAPVSEAVVLRACAEALHGTAMMASLEPSTSLLEIGATSLHIYAIASLLGCTTELIYQHSSPRSLSRALSSRHRSSVARSSGQHHHVSSSAHPQGQPMAPLDNQPGVHSTQDVEHHGPPKRQDTLRAVSSRAESMQPMLQQPQQAGRKSHLENQHGSHTLQGEVSHSSQDPQCHCAAKTVEVVISDSRGESSCLMMSPADLPCYPWQDQHCDGASSTDSSIVAKLVACVDAPVALIQCCSPEAVLPHCAPSAAPRQPPTLDAHRQGMLTSRPGQHACCLELTCSWLLACSHAGDVACIAIRPNDGTSQCQETAQACSTVPQKLRFQRAWTSQVPSSPDAGLQVTGCGRAVAVACLDGELLFLRLRDGQPLGQIRTGGQMRRCDLLLCCLRSFPHESMSATCILLSLS